MLIHEITLSGILSFGPDTPTLKMKPLNVLIGPNGSGKSNFIEAISLFQAAPKNLSKPVQNSGGVEEWIWKGEPNGNATINAIFNNPLKNCKEPHPLRHFIQFSNSSSRFKLQNEVVEFSKPDSGQKKGYFLYHFSNGKPYINTLVEENSNGKNTDQRVRKNLQIPNFNLNESVLSQRKDPDSYPELSYLSDAYKAIRFYREWQFGRSRPSRIRQAQKADISSHYLMEDCSNLWLFLNQLTTNKPQVKKKILHHLSDLYDGIDDININIIPGGYVEVMLTEGDFTIPASRLSDGTIRYLCLLAILCDPDPPKLICIEEPELGLHPDLIPKIADLLIEASERTQLVVTTHSDILVDCMSEQPESVVVCQKENGATTMNRLKEGEVKPFLEDYRLGQLWSSGQIGGNRW